jgi:hypothetical protein
VFNPWTGQIDEVAFYTRALAPAEVDANSRMMLTASRPRGAQQQGYTVSTPSTSYWVVYLSMYKVYIWHCAGFPVVCKR